MAKDTANLTAEQLSLKILAGAFLQALVNTWLTDNLSLFPFVHLAEAFSTCAVSPATILLAANSAVRKVEVTSELC